MNMLVQPSATKLEPRQRFVLWQVGWDVYEKIVDALNEEHVRVTYDRGDLELMSPPPVHEAIKVWFRHFMIALVEVLDFPTKGVGGPTFRRRDRRCGLEPDDGYYFASAARVVDWLTLNLDRNPPPDLALEVDVTRSCLDRMGVYAGPGVPEVWRFDGEEWHIHLLGTDGTYQESSRSAAIPYLSVLEIMPLRQQSLYVGDDRERLCLMRSWVRERVLPLRQAWQPQQQTPPDGANP
jgi:Uma2 family endonuclease